MKRSLALLAAVAAVALVPAAAPAQERDLTVLEPVPQGYKA